MDTCLEGFSARHISPCSFVMDFLPAMPHHFLPCNLLQTLGVKMCKMGVTTSYQGFRHGFVLLWMYNCFINSIIFHFKVFVYHFKL